MISFTSAFTSILIVDESDLVRTIVFPTSAPDVTPPPIVTSKVFASPLVNVIVLLVDSKAADSTL